MFLTPHHFQQLDRHHAKSLSKCVATREGLGWGVAEVAIDAGALAKGQLVLSRCAAVMPDGLLIDTIELDEPPPARNLEGKFDPKAASLAVFLALPAGRLGGGPGTGTRRSRFSKVRETVSDENDGAAREIEIACKDLRVLLEGEPREDQDSLQVARLIRSPTGTITVDASYVPPCLYLSSSTFLTSLVNNLIGALGTKSAELSGKLRSRKPGLADFTMGEAANFWFLHTVNASIPALNHFAHQPRVHPERIYLALARLAGELYTFSKEGQPGQIPLYDHADLSGCFRALEERILFLMETIIPTRCFPVTLEKARERRPDQLFAGRIPDDLMEAAQFYLAVKADIPDERIIEEVQRKVRVR